MNNKKESPKNLNVEKLNETIKFGSKILKILYIVFIILLIYLIGLILKDWDVLPFIGKILTIISPLFIGFVIAWLLNPLVTKLTNKKMNRTLAIIIVYLGMLIIIGLIIVAIVPAIGDQIKDIVTSIPNILSDIKIWIENIFNKISELSLENMDDVKLKFFASIEKIGNNIQTNLPTTVVNIVTGFFSGLGVMLLSFVVGFYMLFNFHNVTEHFTNLLPKKWKDDSINLLEKISTTMRGYVDGTILLTLLLFIISFIGYAIIGLNAPLVLALFCAITNLIPYIGPYIGAAGAGLIAFSQSPLIGILTLVFILIVQTLEGNFLQPMVMSKKMNLHPVTILISLLIFGYFFGIIGMILATPIVALLKVVYVFFNEKYNFFSYKDKSVIKKNE